MGNQFLMEPSNQNFTSLMRMDNKYEVPNFQRDYSWEKEQLEDLWNDIDELKDEKYHYMGYIVLLQKNSKSFEIVDGQQRLTTLTLLVLACMAKLKEIIDDGIEVEENTERINGIENIYIGNKNIITLNVDSRLTLNRNNNSYFKGICSNLMPAKSRIITKTNKLLQEAFNFFKEKIKEKDGKKIAKFIENFTSSLYFTKIVV